MAVQNFDYLIYTCPEKSGFVRPCCNRDLVIPAGIQQNPGVLL
jgi:hypothetical protein